VATWEFEELGGALTKPTTGAGVIIGEGSAGTKPPLLPPALSNSPMKPFSEPRKSVVKSTNIWPDVAVTGVGRANPVSEPSNGALADEPSYTFTKSKFCSNAKAVNPSLMADPEGDTMFQEHVVDAGYSPVPSEMTPLNARNVWKPEHRGIPGVGATVGYAVVGGKVSSTSVGCRVGATVGAGIEGTRVGDPITTGA